MLLIHFFCYFGKRRLADSIAGPLTAIINNCIRKCYFPKAWKNARISPIPKVDQLPHNAVAVRAALASGYRSRVTLGDRSFQVAAPALWNVLPREIRSITDLGIFKCHLKTHLFREAFYSFL